MKLVLFALAFFGTTTLTGCTGATEDSSVQQSDSGT